MEYLKTFENYEYEELETNQEEIDEGLISKLKYRMTDIAGPEETASWLFKNNNDGLRRIVSDILKNPKAIVNQNFLKSYFKNADLTSGWNVLKNMEKDFIDLVMNGDYAMRKKVVPRGSATPGGSTSISYGTDPIKTKDIREIEKIMKDLIN